MLDESESGSSKLTVKNMAAMTLMGMYYPTFVLSIAIIGYNAISVVYIHIGVGFGVARSTVRAMPEPRFVGRVTGRFPRFFVSYSHQSL